MKTGLVYEMPWLPCLPRNAISEAIGNTLRTVCFISSVECVSTDSTQHTVFVGSFLFDQKILCLCFDICYNGMSYKTVASITSIFTIAKKNEKPFFEKTWNGRFGKKQSVSYLNVLFIAMLQMICIQAPRKFMTWGEHVFKVPEEFDFSNAIFIWSTLRT